MTFPAYKETANKHGGANEKQGAEHKETKVVAAKLMNHHKRSGSQPFAWRTCVCEQVEVCTKGLCLEQIVTCVLSLSLSCVSHQSLRPVGLTYTSSN